MPIKKLAVVVQVINQNVAIAFLFLVLLLISKQSDDRIKGVLHPSHLHLIQRLDDLNASELHLMAHEFISKAELPPQVVFVLGNPLKQVTVSRQHLSNIVDIQHTALENKRVVSMVQDPDGLIPDRAFENGAKQLQLKLKLTLVLLGGIGKDFLQGFCKVRQRRSLASDHLLQGKRRRDQPDVRLHVVVEAIFAIGIVVDIQSIRKKNPCIDIKLVHLDVFSPAESHFEFNGKLVMDFGLNINHFQFLYGFFINMEL